MGWQATQPQRKEQHQMLGPQNVGLHTHQCRRNRAVVPFRLTAQDRKIQLRHIHPPNGMSSIDRTGGIGVFQGVAEMPGIRIGVALDDENASGGHFSYLRRPVGFAVSQLVRPA